MHACFLDSWYGFCGVGSGYGNTTMELCHMAVTVTHVMNTQDTKILDIISVSAKFIVIDLTSSW